MNTMRRKASGTTLIKGWMTLALVANLALLVLFSSSDAVADHTMPNASSVQGDC